MSSFSLAFIPCSAIRRAEGKEGKWPQITLGKWLQPLPRSVSYEQVWISEGDHGPGTKYPRCLAEISQTTRLMSSTEARNLNQRDLDLGEEVSQGVPRLSCGARLPSSSDAWGGPDTNEPRLPRFSPFSSAGRYTPWRRVSGRCFAGHERQTPA